MTRIAMSENDLLEAVVELGGTGKAEIYIWRPEDWTSGAIERALA